MTAGADTVVIGAGAAGIAATRTLHDAGIDVLLAEASGRVGGRARSVDLQAPDGKRYTVDAGCGWLHSAGRNSWVPIAERYRFTVDRFDPEWGVQWRDLGYPPGEQAAFDRASKCWSERARAAMGGVDHPLSDFVDPNDPWRPQLDAISGYVNGASLDAVSLHDWAAYEDAATDDNWAVREGYGTLVASHATGLPVRLDTAVTHIDRRGSRLLLHTGAGTMETRRVILAVPTTVLAEERLTFDPPLPDKHAAAAALPLGLADKVFLHVASPEWYANAHLIGNAHSACTASHRLSPFGWPIVESFFGGVCAEWLEDGRDAAAFAVDELVRLLGSGWRARLTPLATTRWRHEAGIGGSYSHAKVGMAGQRQVLATPVEDRIFFAGEACHREDFSTAHGAYATGVAAAHAVLAAGASAR